MSDTEKLESFYHQAVDLWKGFCIEHTALLDATFDEYSLLLSSDIDSLEKKIDEKNKIIERIGLLEKKRQQLVDAVSEIKGQKIESVSDLIEILKEYEKEEKDTEYLMKFTNLLVDIIKKIKEQNKKNQIFINKAVSSLNEMRNGIVGEKIYSTYSAKGERV